MMRKTLSTILMLFAFVGVVFSQMSQPVKWQFSAKQVGDSDIVELSMHATIESGYHLYSSKVVEDGPIATSFDVDKSDEFAVVGSLTEPQGITEYQAEFGADVTYFKNSVTFTQQIKALTNKPFKVKGIFKYMVCNNGSCVPFFDNVFSIDVPSISAAVAQSSVVDEAVTTVSEAAHLEDESAKGEESLWSFFWIAFGGGLIGLLTPCVFPMIPMTVSFFIKSGSKGKLQAIIYGVSIVLIYTIFGTLLAMLFGENFANLMSTHWLPNLLFALIFFVFAISLFGYFEITAPSWLVNKSVQNEDKGDFIGPIFMAMTLVLVSFSCTLPIAGTVAISAVGGEVIRPIVGMVGFSLAFAIPFTFFAFFPKLMGKLPKSGGWLNSVKVCLAFVELAFALKFINVADEVYGWRLLDREIYLSAWIVIFTMLGLYLLGKLRFPHDSESNVIKSWFRLLLSVITFTFVVYMVPGLWGAPLHALSGWLPSIKNQDFNIEKLVRESGTGHVSIGASANNSICETPKYSDKLSLPHGLKGYFDYDQALECAKKLNKPILLDFTGKACVNCRKMEQQVWADSEVLKSLKEDFVIAALYVDERTVELPQDEWFVDRNGRESKLLSQKNSNLQITMFQANAQPYYVIMHPDGTILTENNYAFDPNAVNFLKFLKEGVSNFRK